MPNLSRARGLLLIPLLAGPLAAQEPPRDTATAVPIAPVTVTVLRTPFELREIPYAVAVNTEAEIQRAKPGLGLDEALAAIPGVQVDNRYNYALGERISIRGLGARAQFGVRGARVLLDGVPATMPDGQTTLNHVDLGFVRRAEVIRGPASSLYGNAAGGVIQLETELPPGGRLGQEVGVIAGSDGLLRLHSTTGGQSGAADYLLNVARLSYDGYREFSEAENSLLNARLGWTGPRDRLQLTLAAVDYDARNPGSLSAALLAADRGQAFANNVRQQTGEAGRHGQLGALWRRSTGAGELEVVGYALTRSLDNPIPPSIIDLERAAGGARALFRSAAPLAGRTLQWTAGAELELQHDQRLNFANQAGERGARLLDQRERVTGLGAFTQLSADLGAGLDLMAGARYDRIRFAVDDRLLGPDDPDDSGARTLDAVSPTLGVSWAATPALSVYGNVATSFQTPTTTELANRPSGAGGFNPELEPQRARSYEAGVKGALGAATYQLAAFRMELRNSLVPFEVPEAQGRQFYRNAGSARHDGVEAGAAVRLPGGVALRGAYTWLDARFRDYAPGGESLRGNRVPGVAEHRAEGTLGLGGAGPWFAEVEGRWVGEMAVDDRNSAVSPGYALLGARAGLRAVAVGGLAIEPFVGVTNLLDREYNTSVTVNAFGGRYYEPGPGRALYAGARLSVGAR